GVAMVARVARGGRMAGLGSGWLVLRRALTARRVRAGLGVLTGVGGVGVAVVVVLGVAVVVVVLESQVIHGLAQERRHTDSPASGMYGEKPTGEAPNGVGIRHVPLVTGRWQRSTMILTRPCHRLPRNASPISSSR